MFNNQIWLRQAMRLPIPATKSCIEDVLNKLNCFLVSVPREVYSIINDGFDIDMHQFKIMITEILCHDTIEH